MPLTRRDAILLSAAGVLSAAPGVPSGIGASLVRHNDEGTDNYLQSQNMDRSSRWYGGVPDPTELYGAGAASGLPLTLAAAWVHPDSKHYKSPELLRRIQLAGAFLQKCQTSDGNIDLLSTNFNSPPDTGFVVHNVGTAASVARKCGATEIEKALEPFLKKAAAGMVKAESIHPTTAGWFPPRSRS